MKRIVTILFIFLSFQMYSQSITFSFTGKNGTTNNPMVIDKVHIFNEINGTDTIINGNTFSVLTTSINITEINKNIDTYPNPFYREVTIDFNSEFNESVQVAVFTIEGKKIAEWAGNIGIGQTKYFFKSGVEGLLLLTINSGNIQLRTKLICMERSNSSEITSLTTNSNSIKSANNTNSAFIFRLGDQLKIKGYSGFIESEDIFDTPTGNKNYTFVFDVSNYVPMADFVAPITNINQGGSVDFSDLTIKTPTIWSWDFGDGGTSNIQNPSHTYWLPGKFTVSLTAENNYGSDIESKPNYITVNSMKPKAEFIALVTIINKDESINFIDQSTNSPTSWKWDFGDGGTDNIQNPIHTYSEAGLFTVRLIAKNSFGSDTIIKTDYIEVLAEPALSVTPTSLAFGTAITQLTFNIQNTGTGTLTWAASEDISWLILSPESGETTTETDQVTVDINRAGLAPGNYSGTIIVTSDGGNQDVGVTMEVSEEPTLSVTPFSLDFGTSTTQLTLNVQNIGTGTLTWAASEDISWLILSPESGETTTEADQATVDINRAGLAPGNYSGTITVTSNGGNQDVGITMEVSEEPTLSVTPTSLAFGTRTTSKSLQIKNSGTDTLTWVLSEGITWLTLSTVSGKITTEDERITVRVYRTGLAIGDYSGSITVTSDGGNQDVSVTMEVPEEPTLSVTPVSLDFGTATTQLSFDIENSGTSTLTWAASEQISWLILSPESGEATTETDQVTLDINRSGLAPGNYLGTITVTSDGGNQDVSVTMEVSEEPTLSVTPTSLDFGTATTQLTFNIQNTGTGTLTWAASEDISWLILSPESGETTSETDQVTADINRSGLVPGNYSGTITVTSDGGNQDVSVTLEFSPKLPTVTTTEITQITQTTAISGGNVTSDGGVTVSARGICWSTNPNPTIADNKTNDGIGTGEYTSIISGLIANTSYYVRAYATNSEGTAYGGQVEFITSEELTGPTVTTSPVTDITSTTATVGGNLISENGFIITNRAINLGRSTTVLDFTYTLGPGIGPFSTTAENLRPNTTYYVRALAFNLDVSGVGEWVTFKTLPGPPYIGNDFLHFWKNSITQLTSYIENGGNGTLIWSIHEEIDWLTVSPISGELTTETDYITVTVDRTGLAPGQYNGLITVISNDGNQDISVIMNVQEEPTLSVTPTSLAFGQQSTGQYFKIENSGTGTLTWSINEEIDWLTLTPISGSTTTESEWIYVEVDRSYLPPGDYSGTISITSNGGTQDVSVTVTEGNVGCYDSRDGKIYKTVKIGRQWWMAENMAYLPAVSPPSLGSETVKHYYVYGYDGTSVSAAKATANYTTYGVLYNWPAAMAGARSSISNPSGVLGICPQFWHLPSNREWTELENYLIENGYGYEGSGDDIAKSLAAKTAWISFSSVGTPGNDPESNNSSGFLGLPGGHCYYANGDLFRDIGYNGKWWSTNEGNFGSAWGRSLNYNSTNVNLHNPNQGEGFSVRCVRD